MSKELRALNRIKDFMSANASHWKQDIEMIKKALKDKERQDSALKVLKEVIQFNSVLPEIEISDDGSVARLSQKIALKQMRDMENKKRELLRQWVLETCFPQELKALEIIKGHLFITKCNLEHFIDIKDKREDKVVIQIAEMCLSLEEYNLLKEVINGKNNI